MLFNFLIRAGSLGIALTLTACDGSSANNSESALPVAGAAQETSVWSGSWQEGATYEANAVVVADGIVYLSNEATTSLESPRFSDAWSPVTNEQLDPLTVEKYTGIVWRGPWSSDATYVEGDLVTFEGRSYVALADQAEGISTTDIMNWTIFADRGEAGESGNQGDIGPAGPQGLVGSTGPKGEDGSKGDTGLLGAPGSIGPKGNTGDVGPAGPKGDEGIAGSVGPKGDTGPVGPQGPEGVAGIAGSIGLKGDTGDVGSVGPQGDAGVAGSVGPKGDTGDVGSVGPQGDAGVAGSVGAKGDTGDVGPVGPQGDVGVVGSVGAKGDTGDVGPAGLKGDTGVAGEKGDIGDAGPQGDAGAVGSVGAKGDTGDVGPAGLKGDTGVAGEKGDIGDAGPQGDAGAVGSVGAKGDTGDVGPVGPVGLKGDTGDIGANGPQGDAGAAGSVGAKGDTGDVGADGPQGNVGDAGPKGLTWKGAWQLGISYQVDDAVSNEGNSYIAIQDTSGSEITSNASFWELLAQAGTSSSSGSSSTTTESAYELVGFSGTQVNGAAGFKAMRDACTATFGSTARLATSEDVFKTADLPVASGNAWVQSVSAGIPSIDMYTGLSVSTTSMNCNGWTESNSNNALTVAGSNFSSRVESFCYEQLNVACAIPVTRNPYVYTGASSSSVAGNVGLVGMNASCQSAFGIDARIATTGEVLAKDNWPTGSGYAWVQSLPVDGLAGTDRYSHRSASALSCLGWSSNSATSLVLEQSSYKFINSSCGGSAVVACSVPDN